jgi:hypothetical protein
MAGLNLFTNNAATTLASNILSGASSLTVAAGTGALFPNPSAGQYFYCTLANNAGTVEIIKVTARSGDTFSTIVRGQDGTSAAGWSSGDKVELRLVNADLVNFPQLDSTNTFSQQQTFSNLTASKPVFTDGSKGLVSTGTLGADQGGTGQSSLTANNVILGNGTSGVQFVAPGTNGNVLTSNGTTWTSGSAPGFPAGTRLSFQQTSAPTGWTKDTTAAINDAVLRLVTGSVSSGGSTAFSTFPSHTHAVTTGSSTPAAPAGIQSASTYGSGSVPSGATGGGGSHNHSMTTNIKYYDFIIASKN